MIYSKILYLVTMKKKTAFNHWIKSLRSLKQKKKTLDKVPTQRFLV